MVRGRTPLGVVLGLALAAAATLTLAGRAASAPRLAPVPADRLVASALAALAADRPLTGQVAATVDLGLPKLVSSRLGAAAGPLDAISGEHRLRIWSSPEGRRLAELLPAAERAVVVGRGGVWAWDSTTFTAWRLADGPPPPAPAAAAEAASLADPLALAHRALAAVRPTTAVSVAAGVRVAGRPAYLLRLAPRQAGTLVGRVEVAVDAASRLPLRVAVWPRGAAHPALAAAFTSLRLGPVDSAVFEFRPPPGAAVRRPPAAPAGARAAPRYLPRVVGAGWTAVVALPLPREAAAAMQAGPVGRAGLLPFSGPLLSAWLARRGDDAWLLYGAVPQAALLAAERRLPS